MLFARNRVFDKKLRILNLFVFIRKPNNDSLVGSKVNLLLFDNHIGKRRKRIDPRGNPVIGVLRNPRKSIRRFPILTRN